MIIEKLIAKNFKKHKSLDMDFTAGKNLITGPNYSGKSTVLQAILVGLYGNSTAPGTTQDLIHDDAKDFEVELFLDNGVYIKRTSRNSSIIDAEGEVKVRTHSAVNRWCEEMLETDRKTFLKVFASEQGSPQALLDMEGAELQKFIESAIGLERLDKVKKVVNSKALEAKASHGAYADVALTESVRADYESKVEENTLKYTLNTQAVADADAVLATLHEKRSSIKLEIGRQTKAKAAEEAYDLSRDVVVSLLGRLPEPLAVVDTSRMKEVLRADTDAYHAYTAAKNTHNKACKGVSETSDYLQEKLEALQFERPPAACADEARAIKASCTESVVKAKARVSELQALLEGSACPTCERAYEKSRDIGCIELDLEKAKEEVAGAKAVRVKAVEELVAKEVEESVFDAAEKKASRLTGAVEELKKQLARAVVKRDGCAVEPNSKFEGDTWRNCTSEQQEIIEKLDKDNTRSEEVESQRAELSEKLTGLIPPTREVYTLGALEIQATELDDRFHALHNERADNQAVAAESSTKRDSLLADLKKDAEIRVLMEGFAKQTVNYVAISDALTQAREVASRDAFDQTLGIASEFVKTCTGGDISEVFMGDSGIRYKENDRDRGTVSASGAQKTLIGLGMKLGLSQIVKSPFGALLLDEISADMDDDISLACLTVLGDYCEQAIIVSHMPSDVADNIVEL